MVTAEVGLVLEFGARLRLLMLAQVAAVLPTRQNDLIRLQMDAVGEIDFDEGTASLDATLYDSRLLKKYVLTGDMALRMKWKGNPNFALSVGGLHPAYNAPGGFPKLERIAINLSVGDNPRIRCESYFALTSNTVQFGARAELYASAAGFSIHGEIGYDVLIQFDPFSFLAEFHAQLQLKRGSTNLFKVKLEGSLAGPRPLHLKGKATFEILWWDVTIRIDKVLVEGAKPPLPAPIEVMPRLREALGQEGNWESRLPAGQRNLVTLRQVGGGANEVKLHPLGRLRVKQQVVPLNVEIGKFGQAAAAGEKKFTITSVTVGVNNEEAERDTLKEFFAPGEYFEMSDAEKLSRPSFESMAAGVEFGSMGFGIPEVMTDRLEVGAIDYETLIYDKKANRVREMGEGETKPVYRLRVEMLDKQARYGAAGSSVLRRAGEARYRGKRVGKHRVEKEGWSIVSEEDLRVKEVTGVEGPGSYSEAEQALERLRELNPAQAVGLKILRLSELAAS